MARPTRVEAAGPPEAALTDCGVPWPRLTTEREDIIPAGVAVGSYLENGELIDRLQFGLAGRDRNSGWVDGHRT